MRFSLPLRITCLPLALVPAGGCFHATLGADDVAESGSSESGDAASTEGEATTSEDSSDDTTGSSSADESTEGTDAMDPECPNGIQEEGEECDDGNTSNNDACTNYCTLAVCGDGIIETNVEECDPGADQLGPGHACTSECMINLCGDGELGPMELCDDGNLIDGDECTSACTTSGCTNGIVEDFEECDDGNLDDTDDCLTTCVLASCGDAFVHVDDEECDTGALLSNTAECTLACEHAVCGDGHVWDGVETCDDANALDFDACTTECTDFAAPVLSLSLAQVKQFEFEWAAVTGADYYELLESPDAGAPFVQVGGDINGLSTSLTVPLHFRLDASYELRACNIGEGCTESAAVETPGALVEAIGYVKASNTDAGDFFGTNATISADGNTLVVGAPYEDSNAIGIGGNQADDTSMDAGAAYVFVRDPQGQWTQQAYLKASNTDPGDCFGWDVALSSDGSTLAVSARYEDSAAVGVNGNQADDTATDAGAVYMFARDGQGTWSQQAYLKASNTDAGDWFASIALSGDGNTLAVGSYMEDSIGTGIGNDKQNDDSEADSGALYVFVRAGQNTWVQQQYIKASNTDAGDAFGIDVSLSHDGNTLSATAQWEDSGSPGVGGSQLSETKINSGAIYVFGRAQNIWTQHQYIKASNPDAYDYFGSAGRLSGDGNTLAVFAYGEDGTGVGVGAPQVNGAEKAGAVYVFVRTGLTTWAQQQYIKATNTGAEDRFGLVALSHDGDVLAVGAQLEDGSSVGLGGNQADNGAVNAGAVYVLVRNAQDQWSHEAYVKAPNTGAGDMFQWVSLSADGGTLAVGAPLEDSAAMGIGGSQADGAPDAGAVYLY